MRRYFPDIEAFRAAAKDADVVPVYRQLLADRLTPVSALQVLGRDDHSFLLESVIGGEKVGRYSFIATAPSLVYEVADGKARISRPGTHRLANAADPLVGSFDSTDPLADLQKLLPPTRFHRWPALPAFTGGLVGYAGYDTIRYYEGEKLTKPPLDDRKLPELLFGLYGELVVFDHVDKTIKVVANAVIPKRKMEEGGSRMEDGKKSTTSADPSSILHPPSSSLTDDAYRDACRRIDDLVARLQQPSSLKLGEIDPTAPLTLKPQSNMTRDEYEAAVSAGKEFIRAGDIFQFVPSQRLRVHSDADPLDVYRALRIINPSPFMFYLKSPGCTLIGSSPEILVRVERGKATTRPLAGTRRRGATPEEDKALEAELLADPKERAEHIMLVDLPRNDVGRVAEIGSVRVKESFAIERYSHVMHIVSHVVGKLDK